MPTVELTRHLFQFFPALEGRKLVVEGTTIADIVRGLEAIAPGIAFYLCDERGRVRQHVNIFLDDERITDRATLTDRVGPASRIFIVQALSGG